MLILPLVQIEAMLLDLLPKEPSRKQAAPHFRARLFGSEDTRRSAAIHSLP